MDTHLTISECFNYSHYSPLFFHYLIDAIEDFGEQLFVLGTKHNVSSLNDYSQHLKELVEIFDIANLEKELKKIPYNNR